MGSLTPDLQLLPIHYLATMSDTFKAKEIDKAFHETITLTALVDLLTLKKDAMTKHNFLNGQRIATKVGKGDAEGTDWAATGTVSYVAKGNALNQAFLDDIVELGVDVDPSLSWNAAGYFSNQDNYFGVTGTTGAENEIYYFHPDHLGSSTFLTDAVGNAYQQFSYMPFGETLAESSVNLITDYKFNGKELDAETGLYYYGARYYDPKSSIWLSVDPLAAKYPGLSSFCYVANNPVLYIDPDGRTIDLSEILRKDSEGNYVNGTAAKAFLLFAQSDLGREYLSFFAARGQSIPGTNIVFKSEGKYHSNGIDLYFSSSNQSNEGTGYGSNGYTSYNISQKSGKAAILISLNSSLNSNNPYAKVIIDGDNSETTYTKYLLSRVGTVFHEIQQHAISVAEDLIDNCIQDGSNIPETVRKMDISFDSKQHLAGRSPGSDFQKRVIPEMQKMHSKLATGLTNMEIKQDLLNYKN